MAVNEVIIPNNNRNAALAAGLYVYADTANSSHQINDREFAFAGNWQGQVSYHASLSQAVLFGNSTFLCLADNVNINPGQTVTTGRWSELYLVGSANPVGGAASGISAAIRGNTAGTVATIGAGVLILAGGDNITLSQNSNTISIVGGTAAAGGSQTIGMSNLGNTSGTSGPAVGPQVKFVLAGGDNITLSQSVNGASATVTLIGGAGAAAGTMSLGISNIGNTSGTTGLVTGSNVQLVLAGGNNVTLSQSVNGSSATITISVPTQTLQALGTQSAGVSNAGNTSGTSGVATGSAVRLVLAGGNNVTLSQSLNGASATITISAASQTVQPIGSQTLGISNAGNTSGTSGVATGTGVQLVLAGGNNVTLSQSLNGASATITVSAANQTVESQTAGISNLGNTSGTTGVASGGQVRLVLAGGNNITLSQSLNGASATITISAASQSVQPVASQSLGVSDSGNTAGTTGLASGSAALLLLVGGANILMSQSLDGASATVTVVGAAQTVESQTAGISNLGNTSGTSGVASGGQIRLLLAGGNNITLSQSLNGASATVTISAPNQTVESQTAGISNLGNTSGTSGVASGGQIQLVLAGGNNVTLSQSLNGASATVTISAFTQSAESQSAGISNLGNTSGTTGIASGAQVRLLLAGGNNITLSQSVNGASATVTISAPNQSVESQTAGISNLGNTSGTTGVASGGQVQLILAGGNNVTLSQSVNGASATVTISAFNQTAQPIGTQTAGVSNVGNTAGTSGVATGTGIQLVLAGGNNVTLSQSVNGASATITISAFTQSVESQSAGISNLGNTSGTTGIASGAQVRLLLAGGNNITLSQSLNGASATVTISAPNQTVESQTVGISNLGNTSGTTGVASGGQVQLILAGGNNITLSQSVNGASATVTISAGGAGAASQTGGISNLGNTSGTSGVASGSALQVVFAGGNNVTLSQSLNGSSATVTISAFNQTVQPIGTQTAGMSNLGNTSGTTGVATGSGIQLLLAGGNNVTLSQSVNGASATVTISAFAQTVESQSAGISNLGNTSGTTGIASGAQVRLLLAGGNNITLSQSVNGASATVTISAPSQTVESQTVGISNLGNTSGTSGVASGGQVQLILAGGNNVTLSQSVNGASATVTISAGAGAAGSQTVGISNLGNTAGTSGVASGAQVQLILAGGNNITLSQSVNGASATVTISAPATPATPNQSIAMNTSTAGGGTGGTSNPVSGGAISYNFVAGSNITLSQSANGASGTLSIYALAEGTQTFGMSNLGNTSGTTGVATGTGIQMILAGGNNITLSQSVNGASATITISAGAGAGGSQTVGISNLGNTSGTSGVASGSQVQLILAGGNNITLSQSVNGASATVTISAPATPELSEFDPISISSMLSNSILGQNTLYFVPFDLQVQVSAYRMNMFLSVGTTLLASNSSNSGAYTLSAALYSRGSGGSSTHMSRIWSGSAFMRMSNSSNTQVAVTIPVGISNSTAVSTLGLASSNTGASTILLSSVGGFRVLPLPMSLHLTPGRYWLAVANSSTSLNAIGILQCSVMQQTNNNTLAFKPFGTVSAASNASLQLAMPGFGSYSATSGAFPATAGFANADIKASTIQTVPYFNFSALTEGTSIL